VPRFSVVVPAYNAESTLRETLDAVLAQRFDDWESIVVDDGSTDATLRIAREYAERDSGFRVVSQTNSGTAGAYNTGVSAATGEFVVLCSADDVLLPEHLATMDAFIREKSGYDIYSTNGFYWREDGSRELVYENGALADSADLARVAWECFYGVGAAYRRELFDRVGGYRVGIFGEDYDFWLRAMAQGALHRYLSAPLSLHRVSTTQKSASPMRTCRSDIRILSDLLQDPALSEEQRAAIIAGLGHRRQILQELRLARVKTPLYRAWVDVAGRIVGEDKAKRAPGAVKEFFGKRRGGRS
jgi:glycosyltransferase involved in cell wall biosynthesis